MSDQDLAAEAGNLTVNSIKNPLVHVTIPVSFAYLRHAMMKIAYELAFLWFGDAYLDDPLAIDLRNSILKADLASTDGLVGYVGEAKPCTAFKFWTPHEAHHLAYSSIVADALIVAVRVFDLYAAAVVVSRRTQHYFRTTADASKLRFLAIDSVSGKTVDTTFDNETCRLAEEMTAHGRIPPFPDPL